MLEREHIHPYIGSMRQLASIRRSVLDDGKGRGMRICDVNNGSGLAFTVYPDRGMDIGETWFKGIPVVWLTSNGPVAPAFYESEDFNWLRSWNGGLLTGCGLMNVGAPNSSGGEKHGLHGRLSHTPAEEFNTFSQWNSLGNYELKLSGKLRISKVFGKNIVMDRTIFTALEDNSITIVDTIANNGFCRTPLMLLYHMNLGWPLVSPDCYIECVEHKVTPQNDIAAAGFSNWRNFGEPKNGFVEQVFYHDIPADKDGFASVKLLNPNIKLGCEICYRKQELPYLVQWKQQGCGEYVMGLEPANCYPEGQLAFSKRGLLKYLAPGENLQTMIKISFWEL